MHKEAATGSGVAAMASASEATHKAASSGWNILDAITHLSGIVINEWQLRAVNVAQSRGLSWYIDLVGADSRRGVLDAVVKSQASAMQA